MNDLVTVTDHTAPVVVTWGMVAVVVLTVAVATLALALLLRWVVRDAIEIHTSAIRQQMASVVSLAESANGQYQAIKARVSEVEGVAQKALSTVNRLEGDVKLLQRRIGLPNV